MSRPSSRLLLSTLTLFVLATVAAAEPIVYKFDPPPVQFTSTREVTTTSKLDGATNMQVGFTVVADNTLETGEIGYTLRVTPTSVVVYDAGEPTENQLLELLKGAPYQLVINQHGEATEVVGFTDIEEKIKSTVSPAMAQRTLQRMNANQLRQEVVSEWNGLVGFRRQCEAEVGEIVYDRRRNRMNDGTSTVIYSGAVIEETFDRDGRQCARLVVTACSDPLRLADSLALTKEKVMDVFALTDQLLQAARQTAMDQVSKAELVFEIETGLLHSVSTSMLMLREMSAGGETGIAEVGEVETVTYLYKSRGDS